MVRGERAALRGVILWLHGESRPAPLEPALADTEYIATRPFRLQLPTDNTALLARASIAQSIRLVAELVTLLPAPLLLSHRKLCITGLRQLGGLPTFMQR